MRSPLIRPSNGQRVLVAFSILALLFYLFNTLTASWSGNSSSNCLNGFLCGGSNPSKHAQKNSSKVGEHHKTAMSNEPIDKNSDESIHVSELRIDIENNVPLQSQQVSIENAKRAPDFSNVFTLNLTFNGFDEDNGEGKTQSDSEDDVEQHSGDTSSLTPPRSDFHIGAANEEEEDLESGAVQTSSSNMSAHGNAILALAREQAAYVYANDGFDNTKENRKGGGAKLLPSPIGRSIPSQLTWIGRLGNRPLTLVTRWWELNTTQSDKVQAEHERIPRLVYEETPKWHKTELREWWQPYVLVARHVPEHNWLVVFLQGYNANMNEQVLHEKVFRDAIVGCVVGKITLPLVEFSEPLTPDIAVCDTTGLDRRRNRHYGTLLYGERVTVVTQTGERLPSLARFLPQKARPAEAPKYNICLYTQMKDQMRYVRDWVDYHRRMGIDHFYISDNNSTDGLGDWFANDANVEVLYWPWRKSQAQAWVYARVALEALCKWVVFVDIDQYLFIRPDHETFVTLADQLDAWEERWPTISQILLINKVYGSSGRIRTPNIPQPEAYIHTNVRALPSKMYETLRHAIVRLEPCTLFTRIHRWQMRAGWKTLYPDSDKIHWNHYKIRSWEDYLQKFEGRNGLVVDWPDPPSKDPRMPPDDWHNYHGTVENTTFRDFYRKIMTNQTLVRSPLLVWD